MYVYKCVCMCVCVYMYIYIYILFLHIHKHPERDRHTLASHFLVDPRPSSRPNLRPTSWQADEEARAKMAAGMQMQQALHSRVSRRLTF